MTAIGLLLVCLMTSITVYIIVFQYTDCIILMPPSLGTGHLQDYILLVLAYPSAPPPVLTDFQQPIKTELLIRGRFDAMTVQMIAI